MNTLPLKSVVIGCADLSSYHRLTHAICGTLLPTPTTPNTSPPPNQQHEVINASQLSGCAKTHSNAGQSCDADSLSSEQHHTPNQLFMLGGLLSNDRKQKLVLEYDHSVPQEFLDSCRVKGSVSDYTVVSTTPFAKGYINHRTELVVVKMPDRTETDDITQKVDAPLVSDFLTQYKHPTTDCHPQSKTVTEVRVMSEGEDIPNDVLGKVIEDDNMILVSTTFAHNFGVMNDGFVLVKLEDGMKRKSRHMKVAIIADNQNTSHPVQISQTTWFNLGGSELTTGKHISIKKVNVKASQSQNSAGKESLHLSPSSASLTELHAEIPLAKCVVIAPVNQSDLNRTDSLMNFLTADRYFCVNDVFILKLSPHEKRGAAQILMKIVKIDGSNQKRSTYRINRHSTLFEAAPVHSFIPPSISENKIKITKSFSQLRESLLQLLSSFIQHKWNPTPIPLVLLAGSEGCGKSVLVQQLSRLFQCTYIESNCVYLVADTVNTTETRIRDILQRAQSVSPSVLLLRNINVLTKEEPMNVENPRLTQSFQTQLIETLEHSDWPIIVFGTCDKLSLVSDGIRETALHEVVVPTPDAAERLNILEDLCDGLHIHPDMKCQLAHFADHTAGFLYGDLKALVSHAERNAQIRACHICKEEIGSVDDELLENSQILINADDFQTGLETLQSVQSLDLGAPKIPDVKWSDIGGLEKVKSDILDTIQLPLKHPELFISAMRRSGVLLYGPPGTGKTLLAKAVATECALNFFSVKGPELINMYVGQSEENIRQVFHKARSASPCVIFFDELDSLAPNRGRSGDSGGVMDRVVSQLLAELDGLVKSCDVFVIGATNRPDLLDPALLRPGRFDKLVYVGISSSPSEQLTILKAITRKFDLDPDCDLTEVSEQLPANLTGADLYSLCAEAMTNAIKRQIDQLELGAIEMSECNLRVSRADFLLAIEQTTPSLSSEEIDRYEQVRLHFFTQGKSKTSGNSEEEINGSGDYIMQELPSNINGTSTGGYELNNGNENITLTDGSTRVKTFNNVQSTPTHNGSSKRKSRKKKS